jgi:hypothetical protein
MYQGLSLLNFPLIALAKKVLFLLCNWGFNGIAHSDTLAMAYNNFLLKVGLYNNPFAWSYSDFRQLSTKITWFQNLWLLVETFKGDLSKNNHFIILQIDGHSPNLFSSNYITKTEKSEASNDITN